MVKKSYYINENPDYERALMLVRRGKRPLESDDNAARRILDKRLYDTWLKDTEKREAVES